LALCTFRQTRPDHCFVQFKDSPGAIQLIPIPNELEELHFVILIDDPVMAVMIDARLRSRSLRLLSIALAFLPLLSLVGLQRRRNRLSTGSEHTGDCHVCSGRSSRFPDSQQPGLHRKVTFHSVMHPTRDSRVSSLIGVGGRTYGIGRGFGH
jgi:hypothetical protein